MVASVDYCVVWCALLKQRTCARVRWRIVFSFYSLFPNEYLYVFYTFSRFRVFNNFWLLKANRITRILMERLASRSSSRYLSPRSKEEHVFTIWYWTVFVQMSVNALPISRISRSTLRFGANLRATACGLHLGLPRIMKTSKEWRST